MHALDGQIVAGRYRVGRLLGAGGMGAVYEAVHLPTGRPLALKTLAAGAARGEERARLLREARAASLLDHPNLVDVLDLGALPDGRLFLVMELVDGVSLRRLMDAGRVGARRSLVLARQALDGLAHAHARGLVHRDIKPENLMVARAGEPGLEYELVKILDFGLVRLLGDAAAEVGGGKLTATGMVFGTPAYMAPEQALGRPVDGRADLYALGVVLFELLAGRPPFLHPDPLGLMRLQVTAPPPALAAAAPGPWCTPPMERLLAGALAKRPEERWPDAGAMIAALDAAFGSIDHLPAGA